MWCHNDIITLLLIQKQILYARFSEFRTSFSTHAQKLYTRYFDPVQMFKWSFQSSFKSESPHTQTSLMNGIEVMYNGVCTLYVINNYLVSLYMQIVMVLGTLFLIILLWPKFEQLDQFC